MREILFRGKTELDNEWIVGAGIYKSGGHTWLIIDDATKTENIGTGSYAVIPESVGQFTGLTDKNGKKIFEDDVVKDNSLNYMLLCDNRNKCRTGVAVIKYGLHEVPSEDPFCWVDAFGFYFEGETLYPTPAQYHPYTEYSKSTFEVIGNIHDNPEFLQ